MVDATCGLCSVYKYHHYTHCSVAYSHTYMFIIIIAFKRISLESYIVELCNFVYLGHSVESWSTQTWLHQNFMIVNQNEIVHAESN